MKCCDSEVSTPYCPKCGNVNDTVEPRAALLVHVARQRRITAGQLERITKIWTGKSEGDYMIANAQRCADRWAAWHEALAELIRDAE